MAVLTREAVPYSYSLGPGLPSLLSVLLRNSSLYIKLVPTFSLSPSHASSAATFSLSLFTLPHERHETFVQKKIFSQTQLTAEANLIVGQLFGFYSLLNSVS